MKKCKRIIVLVIIFLLVTTLNVYATAESTDIILTSSTTNVKAGDTITITLSANCETGIEGIDSTLEYDKTKLKLTSEVPSSGFTTMSGEDELTGEYKVSILYNSTSETPTEAELTILTFEVLETVSSGDILTVKLSGIELGDSNDDWVIIEDKEVMLTVETINEGDGDTGEEDLGDGNTEDGDSGDGNTGDGNTGDGDSGNGNTGDGDSGNGNTGNDEAKDNTIADKEINNAGLKTYISKIIIAVALVAIILNAKCKKYKEIK